MPAPLVSYLQKLDNLPLYRKGKELHTVEYDRGWVEYLNETSDLYYTSGLTPAQYQNYLPIALHSILTAYAQTDYNVMGLLSNLAKERLDHPFTMPLFANLREGNVLSCGNSRFTALVLCGVDPKEMPVVFQVDKNHKDSRLSQAHYISSTEQINQLANLNDKEFRLQFSQGAKPHVLTSAVRNTDYDRTQNHEFFSEHGKRVFKFWNKFITDGRINITINCNNSTRPLIKFDERIWNVTFSELIVEGFSFGDILSRFDKGPKQLNLNVYNITEEFHLEYLIPWAHSKHVWYHTLNKKVHLFDTTHGPDSAQWAIIAMGNFVN